MTQLLEIKTLFFYSIANVNTLNNCTDLLLHKLHVFHRNALLKCQCNFKKDEVEQEQEQEEKNANGLRPVFGRESSCNIITH